MIRKSTELITHPVVLLQVNQQGERLTLTMSFVSKLCVALNSTKTADATESRLFVTKHKV